MLQPFPHNFGLFVLISFAISSLLMHGIEGKRYTFDRGWTINNDNNLPKFTGYNGSSYRVVLTNISSTGEQIVSENGTFCLSFYDFSNTGDYYLSIVMGCNVARIGIPVWIANRGSPVKDGATLMYAKIHTKFLLLSVTSVKVWETAPEIMYTDFLESGNWVTYGNDSGVVWQSFDFPTDVLLPGQKLKTSLMLTSRSNSTSADMGLFTGKVESGGFVLYLNSSGKTAQPYFVKSLVAGGTMDQALMSCQAAVTYTGLNLVLSSGTSSSSSCGPSQTWQVASRSKGSLQFLRLNNDGDLVSYYLDSSSTWQKDFALSSTTNSSCQLPMACGTYGICTDKGLCSCLESGSVTIEANASLKSSNGPCVSFNASTAPCDVESKINNHFVNISGARYFSNSFTSPSNISKLADCTDSCLSNCSCSAAFYNSQTNECFLLQDVLGSLSVDSDSQASHLGFLKFRNDNLRTDIGAYSSSSNSSLRKGLIGGLTALGLVLIVMLVLVIKIARRKASKNPDEEEIDSLLSSLQGLPHRFSYHQLSVATKGFSRKLGAGGFGSVYEGQLPNGKKVAVKKLEGSSQGAKQFVAEVATMGSISHVNIVRLCGFCTEGSNRLLVYDFMSNGSLDKWLFTDECLDWGLRLEIAASTARGLAYLHEESREPIIHLDVKPQNILLDDRFVAKVSDFGMSKLLEDRDISHVITCVRGTPGYLAPEWLMHSIATKKCDVYSFGMVLLELIAGRRNLDSSKINSGCLSWYFPAWAVNEVREGRMLELVDPKIRAFVPEKQARRCIEVALWCIQENAATRPSMDEVVQMLEGLKEVEEPPLSFHFAVQTQAVVNISASRESVSMAYINPPSFEMSSLIR